MKLDYDYMVQYLLENVTFEMFLKLLVIYFFIIWIALIVWIIKDISNRTESILLQILSILIILLLTPFGIFIYLIIRPSKTLCERYYEEIEDNLDTMSQIIDDKAKIEEENTHCYECSAPISHDFKFCPSCKTELRQNCNSCKKIIFIGWEICPYCGDGVDEEIERKDKKINKKDNEK